MVDRLVPANRTDWRAVMALFAALLAVATAASLVTPVLIPTLGLIAVGAGLFLPPRPTALVAGAAVILASILTVASHADYDLVRLVNVVLASILAVVASLALDRRLRHIEQQSRTEAAMLASVPDALFVLDSEGRVRLANAGLTHLVPGAHVDEVLHPLLGHVRADGTPCPGGCVLDGGTPTHASVVPVEGERITRAGELIQVAYTTQPLRPGVAVSLRDVSARVAHQSERRALLEAAARREEQSRLLRALDSPAGPGAPPLPGVVADIWGADPSGAGGPASAAVDLSVLPDSRILALVVDPVDEGSLTPREGWRVQYAARAHMAAGAPLADMVGRCAEVLASSGGTRTAAILGVVLEPDTGLVEVASGGHLPPLLVRADGSSTWLEAAGQAVGSVRLGSQSIASAEMLPGDVLVLYTDRMVTGRGDLVEGLSSLRASAVALRHQPAEGWAQRVLTAVQAGTPEPAAVAALRVLDPVPAHAG
ncbi:MAG TPA: SpoIIE family protein phosphatase [Candidatus Limnocylindrales bacterium]|nr:SpoIIE family protein phosphatase [Candidatus Limnocylindrales bacterium]